MNQIAAKRLELANVFAIMAASAWAAAAAADPFPLPTNSEPAERGSPPPAAAVAAAIALPPGFTATVMAAEPDVQNPIAMAWDHRGRLWVAENYTYAERTQRFDLTLRDRVLIFADSTGDGVLDKRRVFTDSVQMLTGLEVGQGGVWLMCPPRLLFIPDGDRDDVPDAPAETVLDGFDVAESNYHNFANGLRFGPDGWLYGRCGNACPALIGPPGCPPEQRLPMHGGLWRYEPRTKRVEVLTVGTTNPWGHDWTAEGECFFVNTVNGHLWHLVPGAHLRQRHGHDPNPHCYETIDHHADHFHFDTGAGWQNSRDGAASDLGGGHAHVGCMIYAGTNWPAEYRGRLFTLNFHGRRVNQEMLERAGSGYVARHGRDLFFWQDSWFRGMELASGPDGSVAVLDWSDTGECHEHDGVHRTSGRIYRLAHGEPRLPRSIDRGFDIARMRDADLARLLRHADSWWERQARLTLFERAMARMPDAAAIDLLREQFAAADELAADEPLVSASAHRVRALLVLWRAGCLTAEELTELSAHPDEHVRTWAIRLLTDGWPIDSPLGPVPYDAVRTAVVADESAALSDRLSKLARSDASGLVRLALASTLLRLPVSLRPRLATALVGRGEDASDHNLPLLVWHGLIPVAEADPDALVDVATACLWPTTRRLIARRLAALVDSAPGVVDRLLVASIADHPAEAGTDRLGDTLAGLAEGLAGWRQAPRPVSWSRVTAAVAALPTGPAGDRSRALAAELSVVFGDGRALAAVQALALDTSAATDVRTRALVTLIEAQPAELRDVCTQLLSDRLLQGEAARGLARFDDPAVAELLVEAGCRARGSNREAILSVLASRPSFAAKLLDAIEEERLPVGDLSAVVVRQVHALGDAGLSRRLTTAWGQLRESPAEKRQRIEELTAVVNAAAAGSADLAAGRVLFQKTCANCHRLYGEGGHIGPDLTGSGRHDLGYLLENIVDPSAVVSRDWRVSIVSLADGRVLTGVVVDRTARTVTVQGVLERRTIPIDEIDEITQTNQSPMPDGLLDQLTEPQIRDLIAYLRHPAQVPLPE